MKVSHAILTVIFFISLSLAEDVVLKRPRREERKVLGLFINKIVESPGLKEKYDKVKERIHTPSEAIKEQSEADIPALPNQEAVLDTYEESEKNPNASESIKADSPSDEITENGDGPESAKGSVLSAVEGREITVHTSSSEKSRGESGAAEVSPGKLEDKIVAEDSKEEPDSDVKIVTLAGTDGTASVKNELRGSIGDPNEVQSDVELFLYARTLVSAVTNLIVDLVISLVVIIIKLILPFPLDWLFGWVVDIIRV